MQAIPMPDAQGTAGFAGAVGFSQLVLRSSATGRRYPTADRIAAGAFSTSCRSGRAPRASLTVEKASRSATNVVTA